MTDELDDATAFGRRSFMRSVTLTGAAAVGAPQSSATANVHAFLRSLPPNRPATDIPS
jgi:hypothetical protein